MLNILFRYFDLQSDYRKLNPVGNSSVSPYEPVLPQYLAVAFGVIVEPLLRKYIEKGMWDVEWSALGGRIIFGLIVAIIILPAVYKSAFDPQKPMLVQLAALFPLGIGWQSLFTSATKIITGS